MSATSWLTTTRIATTPSRPPASTTQNFVDIATATRIESIENARLTASILSTVDQKPADIAVGGGPAGLTSRRRQKCAPARYTRYSPPSSFSHAAWIRYTA